MFSGVTTLLGGLCIVRSSGGFELGFAPDVGGYAFAFAPRLIETGQIDIR